MCLKFAVTVLCALATLVVHTVGSLDVVNARVAARGLHERLLLPFLVVDTVDCIESLPSASSMPPKRRPGRGPHPQARQRPKNNETAVKNDSEKVYIFCVFFVYIQAM